MMRRILRSTIPCLCLLALPGSVGAAPADVRPDVLFVTIDTLRADRLSGYGYERPTSPNLDRLMARGVRFEQARTIEPLTAPALASMLVSRDPHDHGATRNGLRMRDGLESLPRALADVGYRTAAFVGNWTLKDKLSGLGEHFEEYNLLLSRRRWFGLVRGEATAEDLTEAALAWIAEHRRTAGSQPYFLWVHYVEPHAPYRMQEEHREILGERASNPGPSDRYDTEIAYVDASVGRLLEQLERGGAMERTVVAFASDHGENLGEHNYWGHGRHLWEENLRVPMSLTWQGRIEPRVIEGPALITDLAPTVARLIGLTVPESFVGYDWTMVLDGLPEPQGRITRHQAHKGAVLSRHDSDLARRSGLLEVAHIERRQKEVYRIDGRRHHRFDLEQDPREQHDLTDSKTDPTLTLQEWMRAVYAGLNSLDETIPEPLDQEAMDRLRSLGYAD